MKILTVLTYYRPHTSGLTIYVERLARTLAKRGHQVTVLTSQYEPQLPRQEFKDGVRIVRAPVWFRVSKGVIMPTFGFLAWKLALENDAIHLHLPQFDAAGVALRGRLLRKPTVISYHSDLLLPPGVFNRFVNQVVVGDEQPGCHFAHRDWGLHPRFRRSFSLPAPFRLQGAGDPSAGRTARDAPPRQSRPLKPVSTRRPGDPSSGWQPASRPRKGSKSCWRRCRRCWHATRGPWCCMPGSTRACGKKKPTWLACCPIIQAYQARGQWQFTGTLSPQDMAAFYPNLDVLVVPSLNSTETFGLVQIEAMMNGVPSVASDLPGVRQPARMTGMGEVVPIGDSKALAGAILQIFDHPEQYRGDPEAVKSSSIRKPTRRLTKTCTRNWWPN